MNLSVEYRGIVDNRAKRTVYVVNRGGTIMSIECTTCQSWIIQTTKWSISLLIIYMNLASSIVGQHFEF